jgi:hypothetical protein
MNMLTLNIRTTDFASQMHTDWGKADASFGQPSGKGEYIQPQNKLVVTPVEVKIDSSACREALGLYTNTRWAQKYGAEGEQKLADNIAQTMKEAREVMKKGARSNAIINVERQHLLPEQKQFKIASMPSAKITVTPSEIKGVIDPGSDMIESVPGKYHLDYSPANVDISVNSYSSVKMWTTGNKYSIYA